MRRDWRLDAALGLPVGALAGAAIGSALATARYGGSFADFSPFALLDVPLAHAVPGTAAFWAWSAPAIGAALVAAAGGLLGFRRERAAYGDAHWQTPREIRRNGNLGRPGLEFIVGKTGRPGAEGAWITTSEGQPHVLMVAPTGAGKGVGFVIPNCLTFDGSLVVLDLKGENFEKTARRRLAGGDRVLRFAPFERSRRTCRYNPLAEIAALATDDERYTELNILAGLFLEMPDAAGRSFLSNAKRIFVGLALHAIERGEPSFGAVLALLQAKPDKAELFADYAAATRIPAARGIFHEFGGMSPKILDSYLSVLTEAGLNLWQDPAVARATAASDFSFAAFRRSPHALYICIAPDHLEPLAPLVRLLFGQLIAVLQRAEPGPGESHPVAILIDEFQRLGRMPIVETAISTLRSYGGRLCLIAQSLPGLDRLYGETGRLNLEAGAGMKLYITPQERRTAKELSDAVGVTTRTARSVSRRATPGGLLAGDNVSLRDEGRPLLLEQDARRLDPDLVILLPRGQHPIRAHRVKYFEDGRLRGLFEGQSGELPLPELAPEPPVIAPPVMRPAPGVGAGAAHAPDSVEALLAQAEAIDALRQAGTW